jgi:hypothetical protein
MGEVISFKDKKTAADEGRSTHFLSLDLFINSDTSELWARVDNAGEADIDPEWHRFIAAQLRQLAWISDGMAARDEGTNTHPIASVTLFENSRISTRWNESLVISGAQADWIGEQLALGVDEIRATLDEADI